MHTFYFDGGPASVLIPLLAGLLVLAAAALWSPGDPGRGHTRRLRLGLAAAGVALVGGALVPPGGFARLGVTDNAVVLTYRLPARQLTIPVDRLRSMSWDRGRRRGRWARLRLTTHDGREYGSMRVSPGRADSIMRKLDPLVAVDPPRPAGRAAP